jgi:hypothetical protein
VVCSAAASSRSNRGRATSPFSMAAIPCWRMPTRRASTLWDSFNFARREATRCPNPTWSTSPPLAKHYQEFGSSLATDFFVAKYQKDGNVSV